MRDALGQVQRIAVLGGTSDIGLAIARRLAQPRQAEVVLAGREPSRLDEAAHTLTGAGKVTTMAFDMDDVGSQEGFAKDLFRAGDVDVVVLAAGVLGDQASDEADPVRAAAVLHTNFVGAAAAALAVANRMREQGHGTLVVLSSVAGERVRRANFIYGASKAGLDGFVQGLGDSLVGSGARAVVVRPGFVRTKMTAGRDEAPLTVEADDVAEVVESGLRRGREIIWAPPAFRLVMAILRHLPRPIFRLLPR